MEKVSRIESLCKQHGISLPAASLQFPLAHPTVASIIPGANATWQVNDNFAGVSAPIPAEFWLDLKTNGLIHPDAPVDTNNE